MQVRLAVVVLLLATAWAAGQAQPGQSGDVRFPVAFVSATEASTWARGQFAGGRVDRIEADSGGCLVVFLHGSGVPVVRIALYRKESSRWQFVSQTAPPAGSGEFLRASSADGKIILIGERSGRIWPLPASD